MKVVINTCFGGFGLSDEGVKLYGKLRGWKLIRRANKGSIITHWYRDSVSNENYFSEYDIERNDPALIQVVEELGQKANGFAASLKVVEIPDDIEWYIAEYDGREHIAEKHRTWS